MRTQDEIATRCRASKNLLGFDREVLVTALDFEHAKEFLVLTNGPKATARAKPEDWPPPPTAEDIEKAARGYLIFAYNKASDHRGISASRSVDKLTEYAWLLGRDDVVAAMEAAEYAQYGVPKLYAFADGMGWPRPTEAEDALALDRMARGEPCSSGCEGCGS